MKKLEKRWVFFWKVACTMVWCWFKGIKVVPFCFYRTPEEQNKRYKEKLSYADGYKKRSQHQEWLAMDFAIPKPGWDDFEWEDVLAYHKFGKAAERFGLTWGYRWWESGQKGFKDVYHVELPRNYKGDDDD